MFSILHTAGFRSFTSRSKSSFPSLPCWSHKTSFTARKDLHGFLQVTDLRFRRFQPSEVAKNLFLAARNESVPGFLSYGIFFQRYTEPFRHWMSWPASVSAIERQIDGHPISD